LLYKLLLFKTASLNYAASSSFFFLRASSPIVKLVTGAIHVAASIPRSSSLPGSLANALTVLTSAAFPSITPHLIANVSLLAIANLSATLQALI
jgi:hypothetical protein